jgi:hypothetical protein
MFSDQFSNRFGVPETAIAGAMLASLDGFGAEQRWVDAVGAHSCRIRFEERPEMRRCWRTSCATISRRDSVVPLGDQRMSGVCARHDPCRTT